MTNIIELKGPGVKWEVVPAIDLAQYTINRTYSIAGAKAVCTSCHDGTHSHNSGHHQDDPTALSYAIDLRISNLYSKIQPHGGRQWWLMVQAFAHTLAANLAEFLAVKKIAGRFDVVLEATHIHTEWSDGRTPPNIVGWASKQFVYPTKEVQGFLA